MYHCWGIIALGGLIACADEPLAPPITERASGPLNGAAAPEEEIFGLVYSNKARITSTGYVVTLQPIPGTGACIYHFTSGTPNCLGSQNMTVNPTGIRPGATEIMWGWYNNLDTDLNPCRPAESNHNERHDENRDGIPDPGIEKHCVKPGKYVVTLQNGATTRTRTIDHRLVNGSMGNGKAIEDTTVSSPTANNFKDTIVHFDVTGGASYTLQKLDSIAIDNPQTSGEFAPGDSVVPTNVRVRINSEVTTPQWDLSIGRLLARTYFDHVGNPSDRSDHWNPDQVVRTHPYPFVNTYQVRVEATTPNRANDTGTVSSKARKVVVQPPTGDQATPAGNTFPSSIAGGGIASVTLTMRNTGTTTWTSGAGYKLKLFRHVNLWFPLTVSLSSSVAPGATRTFAFDLRNIEPGVTGSRPAFYKMAKGSTFFGAENGRDIFVTAPKSMAALALPQGSATSALAAETVVEWMEGAEDAGTSDLPIAAADLLSNGTVVLEYSYDHETPRALDIVLKFTFDPAVLEALRIEPAEGAADLVIESGLVAPGEYWVRLTGTVPAGQGLIAGLPFRLFPGAKPPRNLSLGSLTVYYP